TEPGSNTYTDWIPMQYNETSMLYEYVNIFEKNGTYVWNVTCSIPTYQMRRNDTILINATPDANVVIAQFRLYESEDLTQIGVGTLKCNLTSEFGESVQTSVCQFTDYGYLAPDRVYRAEIRVCNDALKSKNATLVAVTHENLTTDYINIFVGCARGDSLLSSVSCNWNMDIPYGVNISASGVLLTQGNRTDDSCEWFAYKFRTGFPLDYVNVSSFVNITNASSGPNSTTGTIIIALSYSATAFSVFLPSSGCTYQRGCETPLCNACTRCWIESISIEGPTTKYDVPCEGQTSDIAFYDFWNTGSDTLSWLMNIDFELPSNLRFKVSSDFDNPGGAITITTYPTLIKTGIKPFKHAYSWGYGDFIRALTSVNERNLTHSATS
ncbi:MAG: hypothetical protein QXP42_06000, partial [Candidatus Micrarchaeia archaeon]